MKTILLFIVFIFAVTKANSQIDFIEHIVSLNANGASSVYSIDLDDDSDIDLLSASTSDDKIAWYENDGSENFTEHIISTNANYASCVYAIDVDGDNDIDVLSSSIIDDKIAWYENDGSENFTEHIISINADNAQRVYAIDVDGDNDIDVLSGSSYGEHCSWYENDGSENFTIHTISTSYTEDLFPVDVDNDGDIDILIASWINNNLVLCENDGSQNFTETVIANVNHPSSIYGIDLNNDNEIDVISANSGEYSGGNYSNGTISWFQNDGSENFTEHIISTNADNASSVFAIDVDGDSNIDILSTCTDDDKVSWHEYCEETFSTISPVACDTFVSPSNNYIWTTSGIYQDIIPNAAGCDSIITINLTVNYSNTGDTTAVVCNSFEWYGVTYTESATPTHTFTNVDGCDSIVTLNLTINKSISIQSQSVDSNICLGNDIMFYTSVNGTSPISYQWKKDNNDIVGETDSTLYIWGANLGDEANYVCEISNMCNTVATNQAELKVVDLTVSSDEDFNFCPGTSVQLQATTNTNYPSLSGTISYNWTPASSLNDPHILNPIANPNDTTIYTLSIIDELNCVDTTTIIVNVLHSYIEQLCMVTVDTLTGNNMIIWEKTPGMRTDKYRIYRESVSVGVYDLLNEQNYGDMSEYIDATADPMSQPYKYKITTIDSICANESIIDNCFYHKTIHLQTSLGSPNGYQLQWTEYEGFPYSTYNIYGRETGMGNFSLVHQSAYGIDTWTDLTTAPSMEYRISVDKTDPCISSSDAKTTGGPYNQSVSNIDDYSTEINNNLSNLNNIYVYPNPCSGVFTVRGEKISKIEITDANGKTILTQDKIIEFNNFDLRKEPKGIYFVKITNGGLISTQKLIVK